MTWEGSAQTKAEITTPGLGGRAELFTQHQPYGNEKARKLRDEGKPAAMEPIRGIR
jgi:hypothetical protein